MNPTRSLFLLAVLFVACDGKKAEPTPSASLESASAAPPVASSASPAALDRVGVAKACVAKLAAREIAEATAYFAPSLAQSLGPAKLGPDWDRLTAPLGTFKSVGSSRDDKEGDHEVVIVRLVYALAAVNVSMRFREGNLIDGLHTTVDYRYDPPAYVDRAKFEAKEVSVGEGKAALPGTLCVPKGATNLPALVLVHGSGPGDRDESLRDNRPFRDIAEGLASQGIAVLRYEKRTHGVHLQALGVPVSELTLKEEYYDDVAAALALLESRPEVDKKHVFLLGHSLGGGLAPKIATMHPELAGIITLAGNARRFMDLLIPQMSVVLAKSPALKETLDYFKTIVRRAEDPKLPDSTPASDLPFGSAGDTTPQGAYWKSMQGADAASNVKRTKMPYLVLQGQRDYQVTVKEDVALWKTLLAGHDAEFKVYPALNHLFFAGEGPIKPEEYATKSGHVDKQVIEDIAEWVWKKSK